MARAYYNEIDPFAAQWLRNLIDAGHIARGDVDERSIADVQPGDLAGYTQCHFFAGIGGWALALRIAGWPDDRRVWTGSCPCQPHSSAARGRNVRPDLWAEQRRLIMACRPDRYFGEQVDEARAWLDGVCADLEGMGYAVRAAVLPAYGIGEDHGRERIFLEGDADRQGQPGLSVDAEMAWLPRDRGFTGGVVPAHGLPDRMALLRAFGNAIVPELAAAFVAARP